MDHVIKPTIKTTEQPKKRITKTPVIAIQRFLTSVAAWAATCDFQQQSNNGTTNYIS